MWAIELEQNLEQALDKAFQASTPLTTYSQTLRASRQGQIGVKTDFEQYAISA